jgi:hypothetical protein
MSYATLEEARDATGRLPKIVANFAEFGQSFKDTAGCENIELNETYRKFHRKACRHLSPAVRGKIELYGRFPRLSINKG